MANSQPNAWQTAGRVRNPNATSRTPQIRSGTQSPAQQTAPTQPPRQDGPRAQQPAPQPSNVWAQRGSSSNVSNGPVKADTSSSAQELHQPVNGFNLTETKGFLSRDVGTTALYKAFEAVDPSARSGGGGGGALSSKASQMANNQPFFLHLAKQVAATEDGG